MTDVGVDAATPEAQDILAEANTLLRNGKSDDNPNVGKWEMQLLCPSCGLKMLTSKTRAALEYLGCRGDK
jgi:hypothetical protein